MSVACAAIAGACGILVLLGWLGSRRILQSFGGVSIAVVPLPVALYILISAFMISVTTSLIERALQRVVDHADAARRQAEEIRALNADLEHRISEQAARITDLDQRLKEARDEADRVTRSKSDFLSRMSHELRTSLNSLLGFAQLLEMDDLPPEQRTSADHILSAGQRLLELVNKTLDFARVETGRLSLSSEPVAVDEIVEHAWDAVRPLAAEFRVQVHADSAGPRAQYVRADPERLTQVLVTLLSNAIRFNREGGMVTLACEERPGHRLRIQVSDTGRGIPAEGMNSLFVPFERPGGEPDEANGTGLSLALSRRLVEAMGGTIGAESTVGEGSTFWMELPLADSPAMRTAGEESVPSPAGALRPKEHSTVLYIEDNLSNLKLVEGIIAHRPRIHLISALQGRRGLELALEHRPDLILLDLHLPDIRGDEVLRRLRQDPATRRIPVVVISADALPDQITRILGAGARAYLTKPIDVPKLLALVDETLMGADPSGQADAPQAPSTIPAG